MKKYFCLQLKLSGKLLPFVLGVTLALLLGLGLILSGLYATLRNSQGSQEFVVALSGDTDNQYMQWGLAALHMGGEDKFSFSVVEMPQKEAHAALEKGQIAAYVIIPEGLMEKALAGEDFEPITYVTSAGAEGISSFLKREITAMVTTIVTYSQKGSYGLADLLTDQELDVDIDDHMTVLSLDYANLIFDRDAFYETEVLGVSDGLSTVNYYICAVIMLLLILMGLPFAAIYIKRDYALPRMLRSRGFAAWRQLLCEYGAHLLSMAVLLGFVFLVGAIAMAASPNLPADILPELAPLALRLIPVLLMICALNIMLFTLAGNMVSGLLLHFFGAIGLCYISGCIYPVSAFPLSVQRLAAFLPTGIARYHISTGFSGNAAWGSFGGLMAYTLAFFGIALLVRSRKISGIER